MKTAFLVLTIVALPLHLLSMPRSFLGLAAKGRAVYPALYFSVSLIPLLLDTDLAYAIGLAISILLIPWLFSAQDIGSPRLAIRRMLRGEQPKPPHELDDEVLVRTANSRYFDAIDPKTASDILAEIERRGLRDQIRKGS